MFARQARVCSDATLEFPAVGSSSMTVTSKIRGVSRWWTLRDPSSTTGHASCQISPVAWNHLTPAEGVAGSRWCETLAAVPPGRGQHLPTDSGTKANNNRSCFASIFTEVSLTARAWSNRENSASFTRRTLKTWESGQQSACLANRFQHARMCTRSSSRNWKKNGARWRGDPCDFQQNWKLLQRAVGGQRWRQRQDEPSSLSCFNSCFVFACQITAKKWTSLKAPPPPRPATNPSGTSTCGADMIERNTTRQARQAATRRAWLTTLEAFS